MTVPSTARRAGPFTGSGSLTSYPFTFKVFQASDVAVTVADTDGVETVLVLDSTMLVSLNADQDATPGGSVQYAVGGVATALTAGYRLAITGAGLPFEQTADLPQGGNFNPVVIENALDNLEMQVQLVNDQAERSLTLPVTAPDGFDTTLPTPVANNFIAWDQDGLGMRNVDPNTLATVVAFAAWQSAAFNGDGVTVAFALTSDPGNSNNLDVTVSGVPQRNGIDFTVSGTTLTFDTAPPAGTNNVFARWGQALPEGTSALEPRLANLSDASQGAGMSGYEPTLFYLHKTVGGRLNETVSISKFMTSNAMRTDVLARTKMIAMDGVIQNAWDSGEHVTWLDGDFRVDGDVSSFVVPRFTGKGVEGTRIFCYALSGRCFEFLNDPGSFDEGGIWTDMSFNSFTNHFTGTGVQTAFVLSYTPTSDANYAVYVDGVARTLGVHYTRSGATITFMVAPLAGARIYVPYGTADMLRLNGLVYNTSKVGDLLFRGHGGIGGDFYDCLTLKPYRLRSQGGYGLGLVQRKGNHFVFEQPSVESCGSGGIYCDNDGAGYGENFGGGINDPHVEECVGNAITIKGKQAFNVSSPNPWIQVSSGPAANAFAAVEFDSCKQSRVKGLLNTGGTVTNLIAVKLTGSIKGTVDIETYGFASGKDIVSDAASNRNRITGFREESQGKLEATDSSTIKNYYANYAGSGGEFGLEQSYNYFRLSDASGNTLQDVRLVGNTQPKQPSVLARLSAQQVDVTGDATLYAIIPDVEIQDRGSNYAAGTGTAPVTGSYLISGVAELNGLLGTHTTHELFIITSNRTFNFIETMGTNPFTTRSLQLHTPPADVDVGDTITLAVRISGGTKVVDVNGGGGMRTFFGFQLLS